MSEGPCSISIYESAVEEIKYEIFSESTRQTHYGEGKQPWDTIVDLGLAPQFSAANIIKYLRRDKQPEHSQQSARWYYMRLIEMIYDNKPDALYVFTLLVNELTADEFARLSDFSA